MVLSMLLQGGETIRAKKDKKIKDKKDVTKDLLFEFYCTWYLCFMKSMSNHWFSLDIKYLLSQKKREREKGRERETKERGKKKRKRIPLKHP